MDDTTSMLYYPTRRMGRRVTSDVDADWTQEDNIRDELEDVWARLAEHVQYGGGSQPRSDEFDVRLFCERFGYSPKYGHEKLKALEAKGIITARTISKRKWYRLID